MRITSLFIAASVLGTPLYSVGSYAQQLSLQERNQTLQQNMLVEHEPTKVKLTEPESGVVEDRVRQQSLLDSHTNWAFNLGSPANGFEFSSFLGTAKVAIDSSYSDGLVSAQASDSAFYLSSGESKSIWTSYVTEYIGDCSGWSRNSQWSGISFSGATSPAIGRRALLKNRRTGGYTNRAYDSGERSESFRMALGSGHQKRSFTLAIGTNIIDYQITEQEEVIDEGTVTLNVEREVKTVTRNYSKTKDDAFCFKEENIPEEKRTSLDLCEGGLIKVQKLGYCSHNSSWEVFDETLIN